MLGHSHRRQFLKRVSQGTLLASLGPALAVDLGLTSPAFAAESAEGAALNFGDMESLVCLMQETPVERLQSTVVQKLGEGTSLKTLVAAAALANARTFGGEDYIGFHTFMAMSPALSMSSMMPKGHEALPVLKVLYRNTNRIQEFGGRASEALQQLAVARSETATPTQLHDAIRSKEMEKAEQLLASMTATDARSALEALLPAVQDNPEVHRTVLPYRAWDMQKIVGTEHALTLLRQSLHYCVKAEPHRRAEWDEHGKMLTSLIDEYHLNAKSAGTRMADDAFFNELSTVFAAGTPEDAAKAAANALAEGFDPAVIGEAISHAASRLVLVDGGRLPQWEDRLKPAGSVHGDSVGVHASDSANAWRNMARVCQGQSQFACLMIGAWQIARDRSYPGNLLKEPLPAKHHVDRVAGSTAEELLAQMDTAVTNNMQGQATAIAHRFGQLKLPADALFSCLLKYAVSEDGALHAEKYFQTVRDDFLSTRESARWQHLCALARVTASEYGKPAAGQQEARELLRVS